MVARRDKNKNPQKLGDKSQETTCLDDNDEPAFALDDDIKGFQKWYLHPLITHTTDSRQPSMLPMPKISRAKRRPRFFYQGQTLRV